jgi:hypothetical protein
MDRRKVGFVSDRLIGRFYVSSSFEYDSILSSFQRLAYFTVVFFIIYFVDTTVGGR